jgi:hypothetical protein
MVGTWSGIELVRTPRSGGIQEVFPGDVMPKDRTIPFRFMVECKHQEGWSVGSLFAKWPDYMAIQKWWKQCTKSSVIFKYADTIPLLVFKKNRYPVLCCIRMTDLPYGSHIYTPRAMLLSLDSGDPVVVMLLEEFLNHYGYTDF